jgi:hypothetical protein
MTELLDDDDSITLWMLLVVLNACCLSERTEIVKGQ